MNTSKKPTYRRVGALFLIAFGMTFAACHRESVEPQPQTNVSTGKPVVTTIPVDSVRTFDDHPPKDVSCGSGCP